MAKRLTCIELFSGAGGLAIGIHEAGFRHKLLIELSKAAFTTLESNQKKGFVAFGDTEIANCDVTNFDFSPYHGTVDLLAGGPPCQPFSGGGKSLGAKDARDMFPSAIRAVAEIMPKAFMFENVRGLTRPRFHNYLEYIKARLEFPHFPLSEKKNWDENYLRLQKHRSSTDSSSGLSYRVFTHLVNAADYGIPQKRHRFFIIGFRNDINAKWHFPQATHSEHALHSEQYITKEYWGKVGISDPDYWIQHLKSKGSIRGKPELFLPHKAWRTIRQAISDLPSLESRQAKVVLNHEHLLGARSYPGHTGSVLDEPSKTLKAGGHGVPGGENMILYPNGTVRYLTMRECARLQTFPDDYEFKGSWGEIVRQLGNAVPVALSQILATSIRASLRTQTSRTISA